MLDLTGKRITVTGGAGFLGSHIVDQLRANGSSNMELQTASAR
jgi:nucleoside-diphosphate-sugar epimerase